MYGFIALYPVRGWTAQSALHFSALDRLVHSDTNSIHTTRFYRQVVIYSYAIFVNHCQSFLERRY